MPATVRIAVALLGLCMALPHLADAQGASQPAYLQRCRQQRLTSDLDRAPDGAGGFITHFRNGFVLECPIEKRVVRADSARHYSVQQKLELRGNVRYNEGQTVITSNEMNYYRQTDLVEAIGNVVATLPSGSTINGRVIKYQAKNGTTRLHDRMEAFERPIFLLVEVDTVVSATNPSERTITYDSTRIVAEKIVSAGDQVSASGEVEILRSDMQSRSDSLYAVRSDTSRILRLMGNPRVLSRGESSMTILGEFIELLGGEDKGEITRLRTFGNGSVESSDFSMVSDSIDMSMDNSKVTRALAWGDSGATMREQGNNISGTRLEIDMPAGNLGEIKALGNGRVELAPDTTRLRTTEKNFVAGDTVIIAFERVLPRARAATDSARQIGDSLRLSRDSTAVADSVDAPRSIVASGNATLFFQRPPAPSQSPPAGTPVGAPPSGCPAIDYWSGKKIQVTLENNVPQTMRITTGTQALVQGINSECLAGRGRAGGAPSRSGGNRAGGAGGRGRGGAADTSSYNPLIPGR